MDALLAATQNSPASQWRFIVLVLVGFVIGIAGHLYGSRTAVAIGVAIVFLGSFLLPLILYGYR